MKKWFLALLFLSINGRLYAQYLSAKEIIVIAEGAKTSHFAGGWFEKNSKENRFLQSKGFVSVKWKEDDSDFDRYSAVAYAYKYYSKSTNSYLVFLPDAHGRMIVEVVYQFKSLIYFTALRKQFKLMIGKESRHKNSDFDPVYNNSQSFGYNTSRLSIDLIDVQQVEDKERHRFSVVVHRDKAEQEMDEEIEAVRRGD